MSKHHKRIEHRIKKMKEVIIPDEDEVYSLQWDDGSGPFGTMTARGPQ